MSNKDRIHFDPIRRVLYYKGITAVFDVSMKHLLVFSLHPEIPKPTDEHERAINSLVEACGFIPHVFVLPEPPQRGEIVRYIGRAPKVRVEEQTPIMSQIARAYRMLG